MATADAPKYDVAISLLSQDASIGAQLSDRLQRAGWEVFFYQERQTETAGPEGVEAFRKPFRDETRLSVVLFREGWGETSWTAVEAQAIKDRQLEDRWRSFQVVKVGPGDLPDWVPEEHVYVEFDDFGVEGAAAVIDEHLRRGGAEATPEGPAERAARLQREADRRKRQRRVLESSGGVELAEEALTEMLSLTREQVSEIADSGVQINVQERDRDRFVWAVNVPQEGLTFAWSQRYSNSLKSSHLVIRELDAPAHFNGWAGREPNEINVDYADVDLDANNNLVWRIEGGPERTFASTDLVERYLSRLIDRHFGDDGDDDGPRIRSVPFRV